jgi:type II secretion system protein D
MRTLLDNKLLINYCYIINLTGEVREEIFLERGKFILSLLFACILSFYFTPQTFSQDTVDETDQAVEEEHPEAEAEAPKAVQERVQPPAAPVNLPAQVPPGPLPQEVSQPVAPQQPAAPPPAVQPPAEPQPGQQAPPAETGKEPTPPSVPPVTPPPTTVAPQPPAPVPQQPKAPPTVSFFFDDADVYEVIQTIFADVLKVNYIVDPQVKGRVNFRTITPVPKDEVLPIMEIVMRMNGIGFVEERGLYRIVPLTDVPKELVYAQIGKAPEKVAIDMIAFKNLELKEAMPDIENALGLHLKGGTVRILPIYRLNSLIIVATSAEQLMYIKKWVQVLDDMFSVTRLKIFVYPLQNSKSTHIASLMQSIFSGSSSSSTTPTPTPTPTARTTPQRTGTTAQTTTSAATELKTGAAATVSGGGKFVSPETKVFADEITNSLIILATPADYSFIEETIKKLDVLPRQVVIEALIAEIKLTDDLTFGFAWSLKTDINFSMKPFDNPVDLDGRMGQRSSSLSGDGAANLSGSGFAFLATDPSGIVRARLEALAAASRARVLASPHVLVLDNREARIQVGDQVPIATSESNITGTDSIQRTIQYKDTGVILKVKPQVNEGGLVTLELSQEVSTYSLQKIFDSDQVVISKREAVTNLIAQNGQTIVIGGLIQEQTNKANEGIPFLSKIPLLGYLFGSVTDKYERRELIILLTPHVMKDLNEAANVTSEFLQRMKGVHQDIDQEGYVTEMREKFNKQRSQDQPIQELKQPAP